VIVNSEVVGTAFVDLLRDSWFARHDSIGLSKK
jgi:hypothetical protein